MQWMLVNILVLEEEGNAVNCVRDHAWVRGVGGRSSVKDKRETCSDKNSRRESEILIIQEGESLILDQCQRLLELLHTVTNRACMFHNCVAVITKSVQLQAHCFLTKTRSSQRLFFITSCHIVSLHIHVLWSYTKGCLKIFGLLNFFQSCSLVSLWYSSYWTGLVQVHMGGSTHTVSYS